VALKLDSGGLISSEERRQAPEGSSKSDADKIATRCYRNYFDTDMRVLQVS